MLLLLALFWYYQGKNKFSLERYDSFTGELTYRNNGVVRTVVLPFGDYLDLGDGVTVYIDSKSNRVVAVQDKKQIDIL